MNWARVERSLEQSFSAPPRKLGATNVIERRSPFPLARVIQDALSDDETEEFGDLEASPGDVGELLQQNEIEERSLLDFYWGGLGPISWAAGLVLIGNGSRRYLAYWDETEFYRAITALDPWYDELAVAAVVKRVVAHNGSNFGIALFGSLPTETTNNAADLVPRGLVRQAYFDLLQWWEQEQGSAWLVLAEEHFGRIVEPNHLERSLDILESVPNDAAEPWALRRWLEERDVESAALPDDARQRLFDEWFAAAYVESRGATLT